MTTEDYAMKKNLAEALTLIELALNAARGDKTVPEYIYTILNMVYKRIKGL